VLTGQSQAEIVERAIIGGDLSKLSPADRTTYYMRVCESIGVNPLTRPFDYVNLSGKLTLYARKDCTDQLRRIHGISTKITSRQEIGDIYVVTVAATSKDGRTDESDGIVVLAGLRGEAAANAMMKAETKAKRRATLALCGLGLLDEEELAMTPHAVTVAADLPKVLPATDEAREPGAEG
jgi:hypothetical protein